MGKDSANTSDVVTVALVDCTPEPPPAVTPPPSPERDPIQAAQQATVEHTGADPPPRG